MLRLRETLGTMLLGTASLSLAIVMLIVTFAGLLGVRIERLSERRDVMVESTPPKFISDWDPEIQRWVSVPVLTLSRSIWVPSDDCERLALLALVLGEVGLALSLRRRQLSWLSAIGFALALLAVLVVMGCELLMRLTL
jgi:hypothetical protein